MTSTVVISIEVELAWGFHDLQNSSAIIQRKISDGRKQETKYLRKLLQLCDDFQVPITFDIVGHLLLNRCNGSHHSHSRTDWFANDPGGEWKDNKKYFAPDLAELIIQAEARHELASHTFSHINLDASELETINWEMNQCNKLHRDSGFGKVESLVPPRHIYPDANSLSKLNLKAIRAPLGPREHSYGKISTYCDHLFPQKPIAHPTITEGIVETYSTRHASLTSRTLPLGRSSPHPSFTLIPQSIRRNLHLNYLKTSVIRAEQMGADVHFNTHLHDLSNEIQFNMIQSFLKWLHERRKVGKVDVLTMRDVTI